MIEKRIISFGLDPDQRKKFGAELLHKIGYRGRSEFGVFLRFRRDDPRLEVVRRTLQSYEVDFSERIEKEYSPEELKTCDLLVMVCSFSAGSGFVYFQTKYEFSAACPTCFAGWRYATPLFLDTKKMGKKEIAATYDGEVIVGKRVAALLQGDFSGLVLRPVYHYTKRDTPSGYFHLTSDSVLPPFCKTHSKFLLSDQLCPRCGRSGFFDTTKGPLELAYHTTDLPPGTWRDVNVTWELFGYYKSAEETEVKLPMVSHPYLVVSNRVAELFLANKIRSVRFFPVKVKGVSH